MEFALEDLVIAGVLYHSRPFCVHGRLLLRGSETPIMVELTGDPGEQLRGRSFEFEVPQNDWPATDEDRRRVARFRNQQIGAVGKMTLAQNPNPEASDRPAGQSPPSAPPGDIPPATSWRQCLYLEWFSQNGRVVLELWDPEFRFIPTPRRRGAPDGLESEGSSFDPEAEAAALGTDPLEGIAPPPPSFLPAEPETPAEEEAGYGLIPSELNRELERSAHHIDREIATGSDEAANEIRELELMDELIENGDGTPIIQYFKKFQLPAPSAELTESQATDALRTVLSELALMGVAVDICEHYTIGQAYALVMEQIRSDWTVFPEMRNTAWVQHYSTSDCCKRCLGDPE